MRYVAQHNSKLHIMGLLSDSGVHASREHLYALLSNIKKQGNSTSVFLHLFTDGRDSPPQAGVRFITEVDTKCRELGVGKIATVMGRYYAMDRDRRWERTETAYRALTEQIERTAPDARTAIEKAYESGTSDEFMEPTIICDENGHPLPRVENKDAVIFYNFRIDRPRQLTRAFVLSNFETELPPVSFDPYAVKYYHKHVVEEDTRSKPFTRKVILPDLFFVTMTEYERTLPCTVAFPPDPVKMPLGRVISDLNLRQLRMAETEKERFVGYYFNGMREDPYRGEDRIIVPSPKVATYDLKPEMSAYELTDKLIDRFSIGVYMLIVVNFANPDMVGHTGNIAAAVRACEVTDECIGKIVSNVLAIDGSCMITGDHGNVEEMLAFGGQMDTEHSTHPVPFIMIDHSFDNYPHALPLGKLADIAPTLLSFKNIQVPSLMTGNNLLGHIKYTRR
jgi:2,3-bisphosphoglycerate-independent phosphoglycerate mutase